MDKPIIEINSLNFWYGQKQALYDVNVQIAPHRTTAFIGPSGCGKSTLLRCLNRMNDLIDGTRVAGNLTFNGQDIYAPEVDVIELRKRMGMVFQKSNPFPKSIFDNVAYGPRINRGSSKGALAVAVEKSLRRAASRSSSTTSGPTGARATCRGPATSRANDSWPRRCWLATP